MQLNMASSTRKRKADVCDEAPQQTRAVRPIKPAPLTEDDDALEELRRTDYNVRITLEDARAGRAPRPVRVYADGIYDMFHSGHARQLMQAKTALPNTYLIVGVCDDTLTHSRKGKTVMTEAERYEALRHCRYVDEVLTSAPWELDEAFLDEHKIDFVAHDDLPYGAEDAEDIYKWIKEKGKFLATQRTEGISTTDVIARIIKDYDMYIRRNLARGYTAKELNVSYMREKRIQFSEKVDKAVDRAKAVMDRWEDKSKDFVDNFVSMFRRDGRLNNWISEKVQRALSPTRELEDQSDDSNSPGASRSPSATGVSQSPTAKRPRYHPSDEYSDESE